MAIHLSVPPHGRPTFEALAELLSRHRGDRRVFLELDVKGQDKPLRVRSEVAQRVKPSERLVLEVEQLCGSGCGDELRDRRSGLCPLNFSNSKSRSASS